MDPEDRHFGPRLLQPVCVRQRNLRLPVEPVSEQEEELYRKYIPNAAQPVQRCSTLCGADRLSSPVAELIF
jgi:hypothetical protein